MFARKLFVTTSKPRTSSRINSRPCGWPMSTTMLRLPRFSDWKRLPSCGTTAPQLRWKSPPGRSTFTTSAPRSERMQPRYGPATICENSSTRIPASAPASIGILLTAPAARDAVPVAFCQIAERASARGLPGRC